MLIAYATFHSMLFCLVWPCFDLTAAGRRAVPYRHPPAHSENGVDIVVTVLRYYLYGTEALRGCDLKRLYRQAAAQPRTAHGVK